MINMRAFPEETEFAKFLLDMRDGILNDSNNINDSDNIQLFSRLLYHTYAVYKIYMMI